MDLAKEQVNVPVEEGALLQASDLLGIASLQAPTLTLINQYQGSQAADATNAVE